MPDAENLHDCLDCESCICEPWCREDEKTNSGLLEEDEE